MAHYAKVVDTIVTKIIVADADYFNTFIDNTAGEWVQTSYNTYGGKHYDQDGNVDGDGLRKNYAGVGFTYDKELDAFIPPSPFPSWVLDEDTCLWEAPVAYPDDGQDYIWNESITNWTLVD